VGDVHGLGLMCAAELVKDKATKEPSTSAPAWRAIAACWS
jgi:4-aminobutyrate aminotransferase-like enzyme